MCDFENKYFSTKQAAKYLETSESSIKRWVDSGMIRATKTSGGHRRIASSDLFEFIRVRQKQITSEIPEVNLEKVQASYRTAMNEGDISTMSQIVTSQFIRFANIGNLIDQIIYPVFLSLRSECHHPSEICHVLHRAIDQTRNILEFIAPQYKRPKVNKKLTVICADIGYDVDGLPTYFAEYSIGQQFKVVQLGVNAPIEVLRGAIEQENPTYIWISANGEKTSGFHQKISTIEKLKPSFGFQVVKFGKLLEKKFEFEDTKTIQNFDELSRLHEITI